MCLGKYFFNKTQIRYHLIYKIGPYWVFQLTQHEPKTIYHYPSNIFIFSTPISVIVVPDFPALFIIYPRDSRS